MNTVNRKDQQTAAPTVNRPQFQARPLQNGAAPESGYTATQVAPPIPPVPIFPNPYDLDAEGLTMRDLLQECIGHYIIAEHQIGISTMVTKEGRLVRVESNAYVLQEHPNGDSVVCDYYSLKFFRCLAESDR